MVPRNVIMRILLPVLIILAISSGVQAQKLKEVNANDILKQIEKGEDVYLENASIKGELNLSKIVLKNVHNTIGLDDEFKVVDSEIEIRNSVFENDVDFSYTIFRKTFVIFRSSFSGKNNFSSVIFSKPTYFTYTNFGTNALFTDTKFISFAFFAIANFRDARFENVNFATEATFDSANFSNNVYFRNVNFSGKTSFRGANIDNADFSNAKFNGADFGNVNFRGYAIFRDVSFNGGNFFQTRFSNSAEFRNANFSYAGFNNASFGSFADFENASFNDANFEQVNFNGITNFIIARFNGKAKFKNARFDRDARFWKVQFGNDSDFSDTTFSGYAYFPKASFDTAAFKNVIFNSYADFSDVKFRNHTDFSDTKFRSYADFNHANFTDKAEFNRVIFSDYTLFSNANFTGSVDFYFTRFNDVYFSNTKFNKITLYDADFKSMKVTWGSIEKALVFDGATYMKLIKNFRELEQFDDADNAYYQYRNHSQAIKKANKQYTSWMGDEIWRISCGYGVKPWNTIILGGLIILVFSLIYGSSGIVSISDAFYFSLATLVSAQWTDCYPQDRYRKVAYVIERLLGVLILSLFVVTLTKVMIRP